MENGIKKLKFYNEENIILLNTKNIIAKTHTSIRIPCSIYELQNQINQKLSSSQFRDKSSIQVRNYSLDLNSRTLTKNQTSIQLTEKEAQLIELLNQKKIPIKKEQLIKLIWNYSSEASTHTLETHIYRLRKKISKKFNDNNFIMNNESGYYL